MHIEQILNSQNQLAKNVLIEWPEAISCIDALSAYSLQLTETLNRICEQDDKYDFFPLLHFSMFQAYYHAIYCALSGFGWQAKLHARRAIESVFYLFKCVEEPIYGVAWRCNLEHLVCYDKSGNDPILNQYKQGFYSDPDIISYLQKHGIDGEKQIKEILKFFRKNDWRELAGRPFKGTIIQKAIEVLDNQYKTINKMGIHPSCGSMFEVNKENDWERGLFPSEDINEIAYLAWETANTWVASLEVILFLLDKVRSMPLQDLETCEKAITAEEIWRNKGIEKCSWPKPDTMAN